MSVCAAQTRELTNLIDILWGEGAALDADCAECVGVSARKARPPKLGPGRAKKHYQFEFVARFAVLAAQEEEERDQ